MFSTVVFVFVTAFIAVSQQGVLPDAPAVSVTAAVNPVALPAKVEAKVEVPAFLKPVTVPAVIVNTKDRQIEVQPIGESKVSLTRPALHIIKTRDIEGVLGDDLLPSLGEKSPAVFGDENELEVRNRRIKVLPAFLG